MKKALRKSGLTGNVSGPKGNVSGISGNIDDCGLTKKERENGIAIESLVGEEGNKP